MTDSLFKWDDSFLIGIKELDHEHKALIDDINRLHEELDRHDERSEIEKCLGDIYARMRAHFALEEHLMKEHGYKFFDEHKREHDELLDNYTEYMLQFLNETGVSSSNPIEDTLRDWVINHIITSDKKMSLMVQEKESFKTKLRKQI
ncbi:MAG: bacteriohemerythrin [Gammaproteobacteria bacterium]|nr:bacteriohemerythrin [Gammaproteobacteria bacterium]